MSDIAKKQKIDSIDYVVKVSKRKGIRMSIAPGGELVVHADPFCSDDTIKQFVKQYTDKIKVQSHPGMIRLFGKSFKIKKAQGQTNHITTCEDEIIIQTKSSADATLVFKEFLNRYAKEVFEDIMDMTLLRFKEYSLNKPTLKVRTMKRSWGICHPESNYITLNFELVHYPVEFIEYVICHEFVHLLEPNHSKQFYEILSTVMPDYKRRLDLIEEGKEKQYLM